MKALTLILALLLASEGFTCNLEPPRTIEGVVLQHKKDSPYPFQTKTCGLWESKIILEAWGYWEPYRYKMYPVKGLSECAYNGEVVPCSTILEGDHLLCVIQSKTASPKRGQLLKCTIAPR
jgi:hypothetical protein